MKRVDVKNILVLGSGPIVIGQACEFDYSGTQACRALKEEGLRVVLLNSNPATIMTDPSVADRTYIEPMDPSFVIQILRKEGCDAILPTMGGQTGINLLQALSKIPHALDNVQILGANLKSIHLAEDRRAFGEVARSLGIDVPRSKIIRGVEGAQKFSEDISFPFILRPSYTLGGTGQSFVFNRHELKNKVEIAIHESPIGEALMEESVLGWKEYELEVMRDGANNAIVVCSIENIDPMGVHTGDSITVAPQQTLTDREYQEMRFEALEVVKKVGVETGGCNVQFAVNPKNGRRIIIEMNPRVSRSSALASKVTGYPIAYVATKLALGFRLNEIPNKVTGETQACFEPPIDYVAVKIPRFHFEKFPGAQDKLLPQMQSVGEVLALGASFGEAFDKALNSLEQKWPKFEKATIEDNLKAEHSKRAFYIWHALEQGRAVSEVSDLCVWDKWFVNEIKRYQDSKKKLNKASFEMIDTCAAETKASTPYFYSTREFSQSENIVAPPSLAKGKKGRVLILGSGPNRIGQGVEFDYCCVHASMVLQKLGYESIMLNCNPETVSTDPSISTRLYLEPLNEESVRNVIEYELKPMVEAGHEAYVLLQTGGQTPLKLARFIQELGYKTVGTLNEAIEACEDRQRFADILNNEKIDFPAFRVVDNLNEAIEQAAEIKYPILARPSFVLGGRGMRICAGEEDLVQAYEEARQVNTSYPLYLDKFLSQAVEYDVDGICDGNNAWVAGVMEHVEEAGVHSGDSFCVIPPFRLPANVIDEMAGMAKKIAIACGAKGFFNIQFAYDQGKIFVIECNPRASRTVPFLSKATGYPLVEWAIRAALGENIKDIVKEAPIPGNYRLPGHGYAVKGPVFPFKKFANVDPILGPEMRSTGEVMGVGKELGQAFAKAFLAAGMKLPMTGNVLFSVCDEDKPKLVNLARLYQLLGFNLYGTPGTAEYIKRAGVECESVAKISQGLTGEKDLLHLLEEKTVSLVVNTTGTLHSLKDGMTIRKAALRYSIPLLSTIAATEMAAMAIQSFKEKGPSLVCLHDFV